MKIFEFHFNPKKEKNKIFNSFIYEPENAYERRVGNLYIVGEIRNTIPQNYLFLNKISEKIKESYYQIKSNISLEESLRKSLETANNFLDKQEEKNNISWLGNLSLGIFNLKNLNINFSKIGEIKILLLRGEKIVDLSNELKEKEGELSSRNFSNIVSGNLSPSDKLIIITQSVFDLISENNLLLELLSIFTKEIDPKQADKEIKKTLNKKGDLLEKLSGIFLLIELEKPEEETSQIKRPITLKESLLPQLSSFNLIKNRKIKNKVAKLKIPSFKNISFFNFSKLRNKIKKITPKELPSLSPSLPEIPSKKIKIKRSILIVIIFIFVLGIGNQLFKIKEEKKIEIIESQISSVQETIDEAENALMYQNEEKANKLYQEALKKISSINQDEVSIKEKVEEKEKLIKEKLYSINKIEEINNPELVLEIEPEEINPEGILAENEFFILDSDSKKIWQKKENWSDVFNEDYSIARIFNDYLLIFSPTHKITLIKDNEKIEKELSVAYPNISDISTFGSNIYFLDQQNKEIIRTIFQKEVQELSVKNWTNQETRKPENPRSIAIDGSIWVLDKEKNIKKYYKGSFEREINLSLFPSINQLSKISTNQNSYYLYLLDKENNRIIVLNKKGELSKQIILNTEKVIDFYLTQDGKNIYVLTQSKVYKIETNF
jgi:hypothetical protein